MRVIGNLDKLSAQAQEPVYYELPVGAERVALNPLLGRSISLRFLGLIHCVHCGRETKKSFNQGYCYPCVTRLAQCDSCIIYPEKCHYHQGTCREPAWGEAHCFRSHCVYLANSSGLKVGVTRAANIPTRWLDQGATQAIPMFETANRLLAGQIEVICKAYVADKTNWRTMLKAQAPGLDMLAAREALLTQTKEALSQLRAGQSQDAVEVSSVDLVKHFSYPVLSYPTKVQALSFDRTPCVSGRLMGIKGQYLMLDTGVLSIRKFAGYQIEFNCE